MESKISATEAQRSFSDVLNRVKYRGEVFIVERGGLPIARIVPVGPARATVGDLIALLRGLPPAADDFARDVADVVATAPPLDLEQDSWVT